MLVWVQKWDESESGWGRKPDGYTLHVEREDITKYMWHMREVEAKEGFGHGNPPPCYVLPDGEPYQTEITDPVLLGRIVQGDLPGCWGPDGNKYPPKVTP